VYTLLADAMEPEELEKLLREPPTASEELELLRGLGEEVTIS
jgi:hypothetical protein